MVIIDILWYHNNQTEANIECLQLSHSKIMGYGGALIWTGLARNLKKTYPDKKVVFVYKKGMRKTLLRKPHPDHIIFENNPDIDGVISKCKYFFSKKKFNKEDYIVVDMDSTDLHYWEKDTKEKIFFKQGKNAIEIMCQYFNIKNCALQPVLRLTDKEQNMVNELLKEHNLKANGFIVVEPNAKESFTPNKKWFWDRWQALVDLLIREDSQIIVQVGVKGMPVLSGVVDLTGRGSFREASLVIKQAKLFVGYVGGLMHAARAVDTKAVILVSGFESPELACYSNNINIHKKVECSPCGLKTRCPYDRKCMKQIGIEEVHRAVLESF